jgi:hypothetical protein
MTRLPVEVYRGHQIEIVAWFYACPALNLYSYADVRTLRRVINVRLAAAKDGPQ